MSSKAEGVWGQSCQLPESFPNTIYWPGLRLPVQPDTIPGFLGTIVDQEASEGGLIWQVHPLSKGESLPLTGWISAECYLSTTVSGSSYSTPSGHSSPEQQVESVVSWMCGAGDMLSWLPWTAGLSLSVPTWKHGGSADMNKNSVNYGDPTLPSLSALILYGIAQGTHLGEGHPSHINHTSLCNMVVKRYMLLCLH